MSTDTSLLNNIRHRLRRFSPGGSSTLPTDFTITKGGTTWHVHKFVLSLHSDVFEKACTGFREGENATIDLPDESQDQINAFVEYLYTLDYATPEWQHINLQANFHLEMMVLADKYATHGLHALTGEKFNIWIDSRCVDFEIAVPIAYDNIHATKEGITKMVRCFVDRSFKAISNDLAYFTRLISENPEFAIDIAVASAHADRDLPWTKE